jgi:AraC family transcriptional regulator
MPKSAFLPLRGFSFCFFGFSVKIEAFDYKCSEGKKRIMRYVLQSKPAMRLIGLKNRTTLAEDQYRVDIASFIESLQSSGKIMELIRNINQKPFGLVSASWIINAGGEGDFDYFVGASSTNPAANGMQTLKIPASRWAIFSVTGPAPESLLEMGDRLLNKWLPKGEYDLNEECPLINVYLTPDVRSPDFRSEVWVGILGKREG